MNNRHITGNNVRRSKRRKEIAAINKCNDVSRIKKPNEFIAMLNPGPKETQLVDESAFRKL